MGNRRWKYLHTPGAAGVDVGFDAQAVPVRQRRRHVSVHLRLQRARRKAAVPDVPLHSQYVVRQPCTSEFVPDLFLAALNETGAQSSCEAAASRIAAATQGVLTWPCTVLAAWPARRQCHAFCLCCPEQQKRHPAHQDSVGISLRSTPEWRQIELRTKSMVFGSLPAEPSARGSSGLRPCRPWQRPPPR